jgi:hypothetical protein
MPDKMSQENPAPASSVQSGDHTDCGFTEDLRPTVRRIAL